MAAATVTPIRCPDRNTVAPTAAHSAPKNATTIKPICGPLRTTTANLIKECFLIGVENHLHCVEVNCQRALAEEHVRERTRAGIDIEERLGRPVDLCSREDEVIAD